MAKAKKIEQLKEPENAVVEMPQGGVPAVGAPSLADWGVQPVKASNILIARILPQQPMSKFVTTGKAMMGDLMESSNGVKLGACETAPLEFVPFHHVENWLIFEEKNGAMKFARTERVTEANETWPLEEVINGVKIKRDRVLEYFVLLPADLAKGIKRPYVLSFRRTSIKAGKKLYTTMFVTNPANGKIPAATVCQLSGQRTTNDKGTFMVLDVTEKRDATAAEMTAAFEWYKTVCTSKNVRVDDSEFESEGQATEIPSGPAQF